MSALVERAAPQPAVVELIGRAVVEEPPQTTRDGGVIATGFDSELDELRALSQHADGYLLELEERERARTGIGTLRVGYNRVHGYFIEVTRAQSGGVPEDYIRRQTLKSTERSLVLMDEVGRGTSTYDGLSLAWACAVHLTEHLRALTMFATHYFELTALAEHEEGVANVHLDAVVHGDSIVFMHRVREGAANRSYGLQVAALAGIPPNVVQRARVRLEELERQPLAEQPGTLPATHQLPLFAGSEHPVVTELGAIDPDALSPREALDLLYRLKTLSSE
jgi:DNA mismatch repair ATPase MutS